jgi:uncharacterized membrane protein YgcG
MSTRPFYRIALLLLVGSIAPAFAQQPPTAGRVDARWTAWFGCWQQLEETVKDTSLIESDTRNPVVTKGVVVCVTPADDPPGVTINTIVETQSALEQTIVADGSNRAIDEPGCQGSQRARWSENGRRLFAHAELSCTNGVKRTISGLTTIAPGSIWVDIQVVNSEGRESVRVRRYRRAPRQSYGSRVTAEQIAAGATAAARQAVPFTVDEVKEAIAQVSPSTVEAALMETDAGFPLNAKRLQELDAAGVPARILDLMIALSFPNRFLVERRTSSSWYGGTDIIGSEWMDMGFDLFPYRYAPFGYGMWGYDNYYYGGPVYSLDPSPGPQRSGEGRVVDGLGYTRVRSRDPQPGTMANGSGGGMPSSAGGSSDGSTGGVSSQGYSGGGGDSGRTAVTRPAR